MSEPLYTTTYEGRLVMGDAWTGSDKDNQGRQRTTKTGEPKMQWFLGVAFPKGPQWEELWAQIWNTAAAWFPGGEYQAADFAWKIEDGDGGNHIGKEGRAGCWIVKFSSGRPPAVYDTQTPPQAITDQSRVKRGCWVRVNMSVLGNGERPTAAGGKPGIYINPLSVQLVWQGDEITSGPAPAEVFAAPIGAMPAGARPDPIGGGGAAPPRAQPPAQQAQAQPPATTPPIPGTAAQPQAQPAAGPPAGGPGFLDPGA